MLWNKIKNNFWFQETVDLLYSIIIALIIVIPFRHFVAEPYIVQGQSMEPNFHTGDYIIVNKFTSYLTKPERGNILVFVPPKERNKNKDKNSFLGGKWKDYIPIIDKREKYIKRVIGLPGETLKIKNRKVYIKKIGSDDFIELEEGYLNNDDLALDQEIKLADDEYFMLGDNRGHSYDSEEWGPIKYSDIVGRPWLRIFPFTNFGFYPANEKNYKI